jgi:hypothetical protein
METWFTWPCSVDEVVIKVVVVAGERYDKKHKALRSSEDERITIKVPLFGARAVHEAHRNVRWIREHEGHPDGGRDGLTRFGQ